MRQSEFRQMIKETSERELENKLETERKGLYELRQRSAFKQLDNPHAITMAKKNVARILAEMKARELKAG